MSHLLIPKERGLGFELNEGAVIEYLYGPRESPVLALQNGFVEDW